MATTVQNFGVSSEKLEFSCSSEEDMGYAKTFWQSVQLLPPLESRLVSNDITQRLKTAPPGHQPINRVGPKRGEDPAVLKRFLEKAKQEERWEKRKQYERISHFREVDRALLHKHRAERIEREKISDHAGLKEPDPPAPPAIDDPFVFREMEEDVTETTAKDIKQFEQTKGLSTEKDRDSD